MRDEEINKLAEEYAIQRASDKLEFYILAEAFKAGANLLKNSKVIDVSKLDSSLGDLPPEDYY